MKLSCIAFAAGLAILAGPAALADDKPSPPTSTGDIRDLRELTHSKNLKPMTGRSVRLDDVEVLGTEGPRGFWIGTREKKDEKTATRSIFVLADKSKKDLPRPGDHVSLIGVIATAPPNGEILEWRVAAESSERIHAEGFYILASDIARVRDETALKY